MILKGDRGLSVEGGIPVPPCQLSEIYPKIYAIDLQTRGPLAYLELVSYSEMPCRNTHTDIKVQG